MLVSATAESCKDRPRRTWGRHAHMMSPNDVQVPPRSYLGPAHAELRYTLVAPAFIVIYQIPTHKKISVIVITSYDRTKAYQQMCAVSSTTGC